MTSQTLICKHRMSNKCDINIGLQNKNVKIHLRCNTVMVVYDFDIWIKC